MIRVITTTKTAGQLATIHQSAPIAYRITKHHAASNPQAMQSAVLCGVHVMPLEIAPHAGKYHADIS